MNYELRMMLQTQLLKPFTLFKPVVFSVTLLLQKSFSKTQASMIHAAFIAQLLSFSGTQELSF
jgi:hypothetical protein